MKWPMNHAFSLTLCLLVAFPLIPADDLLDDDDTATLNLDNTDDPSIDDSLDVDTATINLDDDADTLLLDDPLKSIASIDTTSPTEADATTSFDDLLKDDADTISTDDEEEKESVPKERFSPTDGVDLTLPRWGLLSFAPAIAAQNAKTASATGQERIKKSEEQKKNTLTIGVLSISNPYAFISNEGMLKLTGTCTLNQLKGKISLFAFYRDEKEPKLRFKILLDDDLSFTITPNKEVKLRRLTLDITQTTQSLYAKQSLFTPDKNESKVTLGIIAQSDANASCSISKPIPLTSLITDLKGNKNAEKVDLEDVEIDFPNPLMPAAGMRDVTARALAKLEHIVLWGDTHLSDSDATITLSTSMFAFEATGQQPIKLDDDIDLASPELIMSRMQGDERPEVLLGGKINATLPLVGTLHLPVKGELRDDGIELRGKLENKIDAGAVKIGNPELVIYTRKFEGPSGDINGSAPVTSHAGTSLKVEIRGEANMFGTKIMPVMRLAKPGDASPTMAGQKPEPGLQRLVEFSAEFDGMKDIEPFKMVPGLGDIPGLKDFILRNAALGMDSSKSTFIGGATTLLGVATNAKVAMGKAAGVTASTLKPWKLSDSFSELKGTIFDDIIFETANFAFSKAKHFDMATNMTLQPGMNIYGMLDLSQGAFANVRKFLGGVFPKKMMASVILNVNPRHNKIQLGLPLDIKLSSRASLHNLVLEVSGEPSVALMLIFKFLPSKKDPPLMFAARIEFETIGCALSGTMEGFWHNPFGIKGFQLGNLAVEVKFPYAIPPVPIAFGFAGTMQVGSLLARAALKTGLDDNILLAEISKFPLFMLPELLRQAGLDLGPLDILKAIDIAIHDLKLKFAPTGGQIGTLYFDPGISAEGKLILKVPGIIKTTMEAGFNLDPFGGFKLYGKMPNLTLGPLKLTGKGKDGKWGTPDDGPILYMALSLLEQKILISAKAELLGNVGEIEIDVGLLHLRFMMLMKLFHMLDASVIGETYRSGWRIGIRALGKVKIGSLSEVDLFGDINTLGGNFAFKYDALTLQDLAGICKIPTALVPKMAISNIEAYVRMQG